MKSCNPHAIYRFMSNCCRNCQFLAKISSMPLMVTPAEPPPTPWNLEERRRLGVSSVEESLCWKGVWRESNEPALDLKETLLEDRGDTCFFVEAQPGMTF